MSAAALLENKWRDYRKDSDLDVLHRTQRELQRIQIELDLNDKHEALIVLLHRVGVLK